MLRQTLPTVYWTRFSSWKTMWNSLLSLTALTQSLESLLFLPVPRGPFKRETAYLAAGTIIYSFINKLHLGRRVDLKTYKQKSNLIKINLNQTCQKNTNYTLHRLWSTIHRLGTYLFIPRAKPLKKIKCLTIDTK